MGGGFPLQRASNMFQCHDVIVPGVPYICTCLLQEPFGCLYCLPKGSSLPVKVASGFLFPNGIVFKPGNPSLLIFAETSTKLLLAYDVTGPAKIENKRVWGKLPGTRGIKNHRLKSECICRLNI